MEDQTFTLTVVVPVYNEAEVLPTLQHRLITVLDGLLKAAWEIIYVNDGSTDNSLEIISNFNDPRVAIIDLSRNFGKEIAMSAGLDHAHGDAVVVIDADLQDPPELIPELIQKWQDGYDVVFAQRIARDGETWLKKTTARLFYRAIHTLSRVKIPENTGDFRLLSRRAVEALRLLRERHRFMKGLFAWVGFTQVAVPYQREPRFAGKSKWSYWRLWNFALEGFTSFSIAPLKLATYVGLLTAFGAFIGAILVFYKTLIFGDPVRGYPSLMVVILFLGGVQLMALGMIGEYLGRLFNEAKQRPLYLINRLTPSILQGKAEEPGPGTLAKPRNAAFSNNGDN
ncbi:glycosyltransferase family 2 protein [Desulfurivibrio alkaliphilus]|uniref:Glycosyl transferase family 2 n=1 Tax=Desulfurivibrio alkaliphilus (strain DSM 19089 / UNIQEM U267 / AHT2) TaxID=589865 RepID=D6YZT3_DESAT|nr:glycosyltransferase family 2 protein [Desulfurivibrio alkaliphilus]ADH85090.1 glycosyl transferase family 2 [Desulfurivibrio alkaliphilus AHT 2]